MQIQIFMNEGFIAYATDKMYEIKRQDMTNLTGIFLCFYLIKTLVAGGLCWGSPDCSTWLSWISRHTYGRQRGVGIFGYDFKEKVAEQNEAAVVLYHLYVQAAVVQQAYVANAQPTNTLMYDLPVAKLGIEMLHMQRVVICTGAYEGSSSLKQLEIMTSLPHRVTRKYFGRGIEEARKRFK